MLKGKILKKKFNSIMDSIRYFDALGIKLDRKTLNIRLKDGKIYIPTIKDDGGVIIFLMNNN